MTYIPDDQVLKTRIDEFVDALDELSRGMLARLDGDLWLPAHKRDLVEIRHELDLMRLKLRLLQDDFS